MATTSTRSALADYDHLLGPTASAHRHSPPHAAVLAIACRALDAGVPSTSLRLWCLSRGTTGIKTIAKNRVVFGQLVASARKRVALSSSLNGRAQMRMTASRRIVGCLLAPVPDHLGLSTERIVRARHALAILGAEFLKRSVEDGYDSIVMSAPWLAVEMGCAKPTAARALKTAETAGWIRKVGTRRGVPQRWRLSTLPRDRGDIAWAHSDLVEALADGDTSKPFVEAFTLAAHPAITYGETYFDGQAKAARVGHFAWLLGLVDEAGVDPVEIGMTASSVGKYRNAWMGAIVEGDTIESGLDACAEAHGSDLLRGVAHDEYVEARDARKAGIEEARERKAIVRSALDTLLKQAPVPRPTVKPVHRDAWVAKMTVLLHESGLPAEMRLGFAKALASKMKVRGWDAAQADTVAAFLAGVPTEQVRSVLAAALIAHPIPQPTADAEKRRDWMANMTTRAHAFDAPDEIRPAFAGALAAKMQRRGYPDHVAAKVAARIAGLDTTEVAA